MFNAAPGTAATDDFRLEQTDDGLGERVVVGVADAAHRGLDSSLEQAFGVADRDVLPAESFSDCSLAIRSNAL